MKKNLFLLLSLLWATPLFAQQTIDPRLLPNGVTRQTQIDGVNASGNDPLNFQQSTEIDPVDNGAGVVQWVLRNNSIADGRIISITTRSKLPAGLAYEDEANTWSLAQIFNGSVALGTTGTFTIAGSSSGLITIGRAAAAGTYNFNLPVTAGAAGQPLLSGGGGANLMTFGTLGVAGGGTGSSSLTGSRCLRTNAGGTQIEVAASDCGVSIVDQAGSYVWTGTNSWRDGNFSIIGSADQTKGIKFEVDGLPGGTVRTYTTPNADTNLLGGSDIGGTIQGYSAGLAAYAALVTSANKYVYYTGLNTPALGDISATGISLLAGSDAAAMRSTLGTLAATGTAMLGGISFSGDVTPAQITSDQDNYSGCAVASNAVCRLSTDAPRELRALAAGADGLFLILYNVGGANIVLINEAGTSTDINRFAINADITLGPNQGLILQYDATSLRWRAASGISGGAGQAADNDLTSLAALGGTGFPTRVGTDIWLQRTFANGTGITWTNPAGIAGNPQASVTSTVVMTDRSSTWTTGDVNLRSASSFSLPNATGAAPTTPATVAFDLTSQTYRAGLTNGSTVTLATTGLLSSYQPLHANLTGISSLSGGSGARIPYIDGAGNWGFFTKILCINSGGNVIHTSSISPLTETCDASASGLSGATNNYGLFATGATTFASSDALQLDGSSNVWAKNGLVVGDVSTNSLSINTAAVTGAKTWTALNFNGTVRVSTGAFTPGNVVTTDANGLLIDGGAAGAGDVVAAGPTTLEQATIANVGVGAGTNIVTLPIAPYWPSGSLILPSTSTCTLGAVAAINSGPSIDAVVCADAATSIFEGNVVLKQAVTTVTFTLTVNDVDSSSQHFGGGFKAMCRNNNTAVDATWGTAQTVDITMATANNNYTGTTSAVTPNGTCSVGATLFWQFVADNAGTYTDDGDARVLGVLMKQAS